MALTNKELVNYLKNGSDPDDKVKDAWFMAMEEIVNNPYELIKCGFVGWIDLQDNENDRKGVVSDIIRYHTGWIDDEQVKRLLDGDKFELQNLNKRKVNKCQSIK